MANYSKAAKLLSCVMDRMKESAGQFQDFIDVQGENNIQCLRHELLRGVGDGGRGSGRSLTYIIIIIRSDSQSLLLEVIKSLLTTIT